MFRCGELWEQLFSGKRINQEILVAVETGASSEIFEFLHEKLIDLVRTRTEEQWANILSMVLKAEHSSPICQQIILRQILENLKECSGNPFLQETAPG